MPFAVRIALHMAFSRSGRLYRAISLLSVAGICVAVAALLIVMAVINGFRAEFVAGLLRAEPHVTIRAMGRALGPTDAAAESIIAALPGVVSVRPYFMQEVLVARGKRVGGGLLKGVPTDAASSPAYAVAAGGWPPAEGEVALGKELASRVGAAVGDTVVLATFLSVGEEPSLSAPRVKSFRVAAVLDLGVFQYNNSMVVTGLGEAQGFYRSEGSVTAFDVTLEDPLASDLVARAVADTLGYPYYATSWHEQNKPMFDMLTLQKRALFIILTLMIIVAGANVVSGLAALVSARGRDIGILMAMGTRRKGIGEVFVLVGVMLGVAGLFAGLALAAFLIVTVNQTGLVRLAADVYQIERLPLAMQAMDIALVSLTTLGVAVFCTVLPAIRASRLLPIEILRYE